METRILLGGGGSAVDERLTLERFASWIGPSGSVLYLPIAMANPGDAQYEWINSALGPLGINSIEMWTTLQGHDPAKLFTYTGIFIGGGNTYLLLQRLREAGFIEAIAQFAAGGGALYGGSAGAILFGRDISTCAHMDENSVGLVNSSGLDLVHGHAIWCHYQTADEPLIRTYVADTQIPVIALTETSGLWVRAPGNLHPLGTTPVLRFTPDGTPRAL